MQASRIQQLLDQEQPLLIVDVRSETEYRSGHIMGALHIPFWKVLARRAVFAEHRSCVIVLCCEHGPRARLAGWLLARVAGIAGIDYLDGHMSHWRRDKRPLASFSSRLPEDQRP